jgi:hypothetical protein
MINFQPDRGTLFNPTVMIASLRGRIEARAQLLGQSEGDAERLKHEQAIADYEAQIDQLQRASA